MGSNSIPNIVSGMVSGRDNFCKKSCNHIGFVIFHNFVVFFLKKISYYTHTSMIPSVYFTHTNMLLWQ